VYSVCVCVCGAYIAAESVCLVRCCRVVYYIIIITRKRTHEPDRAYRGSGRVRSVLARVWVIHVCITVAAQCTHAYYSAPAATI
jgi:hypothetical protein